MYILRGMIDASDIRPVPDNQEVGDTLLISRTTATCRDCEMMRATCALIRGSQTLWWPAHACFALPGNRPCKTAAIVTCNLLSAGIYGL